MQNSSFLTSFFSSINSCVYSAHYQTVFPQHALVETYFKLNQAYEAHERALSWETSPHTWLVNTRAIEMENGLIPVPASSGFSVGLRGARLNELLELRAEKKISSWNISVTTPLEGSSDDCISNILHQPLSIHSFQLAPHLLIPL